MKSISALAVLLLVSLMGVKAQKPIIVTVDSLDFGKGRIPGLSVLIPEVNYEKTLKAWTKELQAGTKSKLITENNELTIFGAKIKDLSPNPVNVYSKLVNADSAQRLNVSFEVKKDVYIDKNTNEADLSKAKIYLKEFAKSQYVDLVKDQVDAEDKKLRSLEKELSSLEKEKTSLQKSIESDYTTIVTEKDNITVQNNELASVTAEIIDQNQQLSATTDAATKKTKANYIDGLEKRKKKVQSSIESSQNKINKLNNNIDKANAEIPRNEKMQEQVSGKIANQQAVYQKFADKLNNIKTY
jgi:chromosome segregation ATPase